MASRLSLTRFMCALCLEEKQEKKSRSIGNSKVCYHCTRERIVPLFQKALAYEHAYPPQFGQIELNIDDFTGLIVRETGDPMFVERYRRRELEYYSKERTYCRHKVNERHLPETGALSLDGRKIALTPKMIETYETAGFKIVECGGFVAKQDLSTIVQCSRCKGRLCGACGTLGEDDHDCKPVSETDIQNEFLTETENAYGSAQKCPNPDCGTVITLWDGCNHMKCELCSTDYCYLCGEKIDDPRNSLHWTAGCTRYHRPGHPNASFDEIIEEDEDEEDDSQPPPIALDDPVWGPLIQRLRYTAQHRREEGGFPDWGWIVAALRNMEESRDLDNETRFDRAAGLLPWMDQMEPRSARAQGLVIPVLSAAGLEHVAAIYRETLELHNPQILPPAWYHALVHDLELREMTNAEFNDLRNGLQPTLAMVRRNFEEGLYDIVEVEPSSEIHVWADENRMPHDDEDVQRLLRLYDDIMTNRAMLRERILPDSQREREFRQRHEVIFTVAEEVGLVAAVGRFDFLRGLYLQYESETPEWLMSNVGVSIQGQEEEEEEEVHDEENDA